MNNSRIKECVIIAFALIVMGSLIGSGISEVAERNRVVDVKGLAEIEVPANKVTWPISFKETGNDLPQLYERINSTSKAIIDYLKAGGIEDAEISVNPPEVVDLQAEIYGSQNHTYRYNITSVITVTSKKIDQVRALMSQQSSLLKNGIAILKSDYQNQVIYEYTDFNNVKPKMIEEATRNARAAAEQFAKDSDSRIGKIMRANQGVFSINDRDENTPYIKRIRVVTSITYELK